MYLCGGGERIQSRKWVLGGGRIYRHDKYHLFHVHAGLFNFRSRANLFFLFGKGEWKMGLCPLNNHSEFLLISSLWSIVGLSLF